MSSLFNLPNQKPDPATNEDDDTDETAPTISELDMLKQRARLMGLSFSNNIKVETLRAKIAEALKDDPSAEDPDENQENDDPEDEGVDEPVAGMASDPVQPVLPSVPNPMASSAPATLSLEDLKAAAAAHGLNLAPAVANEPASTAPVQTAVSAKMSLRQKLRQEEMKLIRCRITNLDPKKKDLPGEILTVANEYLGNVRKYIPYGEVTDNGYHIENCLYKQLLERTFVNIKVRKDSRGREIVETQDAREFAIEVLPPLTESELARLAASQAAAAGE